MRILGIVGSLRQGSFNKMLLEAARELAPEGMRVERFERLREIPPYDQDEDARGAPESVVALKDAIRAADGLLFVTPEYNYNVPGVLKNAIDWASRPAATTPLRGKPAAIMGASSGRSGTIRAQLALRQSFVFTGTPALLQPEVLVQFAPDKFDASGRLKDEPTREVVRQQLVAFHEWIARFR